MVGVLAVGTLCFYTAMTDTGGRIKQVVFGLLAVFLPMTVSEEVARWWF